MLFNFILSCGSLFKPIIKILGGRQMNSTNECCIAENHWIAGWNTGRYGKNPKLTEIRKQPEEWRLGYIIGSKERETQDSRHNHLIKRLMGYKRISLNLS